MLSWSDQLWSDVTSHYSTTMAKHGIGITETILYDNAGVILYLCKNLGEIPIRSTRSGTPSTGGVGYNGLFSTNISKTVPDKDIVTMEV